MKSSRPNGSRETIRSNGTSPVNDLRQSGRLGPMKRSTALRHVKDLAAEAQRRTEIIQEVFPPLSELWLGGAILDGAESVDWVC